MNPEMIIGLRIGVIGLGVTFLALGLLSIVMKYLPRLFPTREASPTIQPVIEEVPQDQRLEEMAVALAVGICLLEESHAMEYKDPNLGHLLEA
jgi:Na+-transporting methylmalonyl-CoA/oxaloacetate decarboxylase gamma subunit